MSRDHYKGVPKTRNAVINSSGVIKPLSKNNLEGEVIAADFFKVTKTDELVRKFVYARSIGDDANGNGTLEKPYRTFRRAIQDVPTVIHDTKWIVDITGIGTEIYTERYFFPHFTSNLGGYLVLDNPVFADFITEAGLNILATPTVVDTMAVTGTSTNSTTTHKAYTDSSKSWTPDEHKGKFARGSGFLEEGVIYANDEDTISVAGSTALTTPITIYELSAELKYGPTSDPFSEGGLDIENSNCTLSFGGIKFSSNSSSGGFLKFENNRNSYATFCHFAGGITFRFAGVHFLDIVNIEKYYAQDGASVTIRHCWLHDVPTFSFHGDGGIGYNTLLGSRFENTSALGHGGNTESNTGWALDKCAVVSGTQDGIKYRGGGTCSVQNTEFLDCAGSAILVEAPGRLIVNKVTGSGNTGYGIRALNGAQISTTATTAVTGNLGDYKIGVLASNTWGTFNGLSPAATVDLTVASGTLARMYIESEY